MYYIYSPLICLLERKFKGIVSFILVCTNHNFRPLDLFNFNFIKLRLQLTTELSEIKIDLLNLYSIIKRGSLFVYHYLPFLLTTLKVKMTRRSLFPTNLFSGSSVYSSYVHNGSVKFSIMIFESLYFVL